MRHLMPFESFNYGPFRMLEDVERDMKRILDSMTSRWDNNTTGLNQNFFVPTCEVSDKDSHFMLSFDFPGVPKEDIKIEVRDGQLYVSGERKSELKDNDYTERRYGRLERTLTLPQGIEEDKIEAHYENGVLTLALPKVEKAKPKQITITEGKKEGIWSRLLGHGKKEEAHKMVDVETDKAKAA